MADKRLILEGDPCLVDLREGGPKTFDEALKSEWFCSMINRCTVNFSETTGWSCVMKLALVVAREAIEKQIAVDDVMNNGFKEFMSSINPPWGFVYPTGNRLAFFEKEEVVSKIKEEAERLVSLT